MRKKTIILLIIFISYIALCNYGIYVHRIKYEYWEVKDLIFFLGILNIGIINLPLFIYLLVQEHKEEKEHKELMIDRHQEEKQELIDRINELESEKKKPRKKART